MKAKDSEHTDVRNWNAGAVRQIKSLNFIWSFTVFANCLCKIMVSLRVNLDSIPTKNSRVIIDLKHLFLDIENSPIQYFYDSYSFIYGDDI